MYSPNQDFLVLELESTPGTPEVTLTRNLEVVMGSIKFEELPEIDGGGKNVVSNKHGEKKSIPGVKPGRISFNVRARHSGTDTTAPTFGKCFESCGLSESVTGTGVEYIPLASKDITPVTIHYYKKSLVVENEYKKIIMAGCMGNCVVSISSVSLPIFLGFSFKGKIVSQTDVTSTEAETGLDTGVIPRYALSTFEYDSAETLEVSSFGLDFGNVIKPEYLQDEDTGIDYFFIDKREPKLSINPYENSISVEDLYTIYTDVEEKPIKIAIPTLSPKIEFHFPRTQIVISSDSERESKHNKEISLQLNTNNGADATINDEATFQIVHGTK